MARILTIIFLLFPYFAHAQAVMNANGTTTTGPISLTGPLNLTTQPLTIDLPNAASGTAIGSLVKKIDTSGTLQVAKTATTDTTNALGIVQSGSGTTGTAQITIIGTASALFDNVAVTDGDYLVVSTNTVGTVSDAGTTQPTGVLNLGVAKGTHAPCGAAPCGPYTVILMTPDSLGSGGAGNLPAMSSTTKGGILSNGGSSGAWTYPSLDCSQFAGADQSIKIQACFVALATLNIQGGIADARNSATGQTWSVDPFDAASIPRGGKLLMPAIQVTVNHPIKMPSFWAIEGPIERAFTTQAGLSFKANAGTFHAWANPDAGTITTVTANSSSGVTMTGSGTAFASDMIGCAVVAGAGITTGTVSFGGIITAVASATSATVSFNPINTTFAGHTDAYAIYCPLVLQGVGAPGTVASGAGYMFGISLRNMDVDCNSVAGCVGIMNWFSEEHSEVSHVEIHGYSNIGLDRETAYAQNSGPYKNMTISGTVAGAAGTLAYVSRISGGSVRGAEEWTLTGPISGSQLIGMDIETPTEIIKNIHMENLVTGLQIGGNAGAAVTCPVACIQGHLFAHGVFLQGIETGGANGTTAVKIDQAQDGITLIDISRNTTWTNSLIDNTNGCTITDSFLGQYMLDFKGGVTQNTSTNCDLSLSAQTASLGSQTLLTSVPQTGMYRVNYYLGQNAVCATPGPGQVLVSIKTANDGVTFRNTDSAALVFTAAASSAGNKNGSVVYWVATAGNLTLTTTYTACTTGTASYDLRANVERIH